MINIERLLTVNEASELYSLSPQTVYRKIARGELEVVRLGKTLRVKVGEFQMPIRKPSKGISKVASEIKALPGFIDRYFWGVETRTLSSSDSIVIERIMELGDLAAVQWLIGVAGNEKLLEYLNQLGKKRLSPKSYSFWKAILYQ